MHRILVTGAATWTGGCLIRALEARGESEIHAVDALEPTVEFDARLHQVEIDSAGFPSLLLDLKPETVVHLQTVDRSALIGRNRAHEETVVGAQTLFGAIGRSVSTRHVVVKSSAAIYGAGPRNPSVFTEDAEPQGHRGRYPRDLAEMERRVAEMQRAHQHVRFTVLRFAPIFGAGVGNEFSRYLRRKVVPTRLGFDARMQLIHEDDAVRALEHAVLTRLPGTFNIAADGQLYLNRVLRIGRRMRQPLPRRAFDAALRAMARLDLYVPPHLADLIRYGLVMDTTRMRDDLGFFPRLNVRQAVLAGYGLVDLEASTP
jgi:UDP-glucose 4-epimerase